jgi:aspartate-semialdehyde dehydrogenase
MANRMYRIGVVGASSLKGKELSDELSESLLGASEIVLLDDDDVAGQVTATGDEVAFIQRIESTSFDRMDFVFFAGDAAVTKKHWMQAKQSGASVIDLTYALEAVDGVLVRGPWITGALGADAAVGSVPDLQTAAVIAGHPAAVMLALVAARLRAKLGLTGIAATVMEPASEYGRLAMDELHQQTVNLLSFQTLPREQYDAQVAFNLVPTLGSAAKVDLAGTRKRIGEHYKALGAGLLPGLALELVQAPVFHGYAVSAVIDVTEPVSTMQVEQALVGDHIEVQNDEADAPSNVSAAGQENVLVRVRAAGGGEEKGTRFLLWLAADNLKLTALNGIACGMELRRLRPSGKVQ